MATTWCKTAGTPVFPPHADPSGPCVLSSLLSAQPRRADLPWPDGFAGGIAHRLDVPTSGALWIADDPDELAIMRQHFAAGRLTKTYRFEAAKDVPWDTNEIRRPIAHDRRRKGRMVVQRGTNTPHRGKWYPAHTRFRRLKGRLWEAVITTGVMHQIRVHAAFVGLPLAGDRRYGGGPDLGAQTPFHLHHIGLIGPDGGTDPVAMPDWARDGLR